MYLAGQQKPINLKTNNISLLDFNTKILAESFRYVTARIGLLLGNIRDDIKLTFSFTISI